MALLEVPQRTMFWHLLAKVMRKAVEALAVVPHDRLRQRLSSFENMTGFANRAYPTKHAPCT